MYDLTTLTGLAVDYPAKPVLLSGQTIVLLLAALQNMEFRGQWQNDNLPLTDAEEDERDIIVSQAFWDINFSEVDTMPVGAIVPYLGTSIPTGYAECIGSVVLRADADYVDLFALIGTTYNTGGEPGNAFRLPDFRGRDLIGAGTGTGLTNRVLGALGGAETHTLLIAEMPVHSHNYSRATGTRAVQPAGDNVRLNQETTTATTTQGSNTPHNNMQPYTVVKWLVKL